jgi:predicted transcriptional regulator of viral defense system
MSDGPRPRDGSPPGAGRETSAGLTFLGQPPVDVALAALAVEQHAVFRLHELCALGLSSSAVRERVRAGRLHRCYHAVYSLVPPSLLSKYGRWLAAVYACGDGAVLSHRSAAALHELRPSAQRKPDVTIPGRSGRHHDGIRIHRSLTLAPQDVTIVNNIPCTTVARTLFDLGEAIAKRPHERAFDQAEVMDVLDMGAIHDQLDRNQTRSAAKRTRSILHEHYIGTSLTRSVLEERLFAECRHGGVPLPAVNEWIGLPDGGPPIYADFVWRDARVVIETDGWKTHRTRQKFESDRENDQRLLVHDWRPLRTTWLQIERRPAVIVQRALVLIRR